MWAIIQVGRHNPLQESLVRRYANLIYPGAQKVERTKMSLQRMLRSHGLTARGLVLDRETEGCVRYRINMHVFRKCARGV